MLENTHLYKQLYLFCKIIFFCDTTSVLTECKNTILVVPQVLILHMFFPVLTKEVNSSQQLWFIIQSYWYGYCSMAEYLFEKKMICSQPPKKCFFFQPDIPNLIHRNLSQGIILIQTRLLPLIKHSPSQLQKRCCIEQKLQFFFWNTYKTHKKCTWADCKIFDCWTGWCVK
jgi:hypothetical protein